MQQDNVVREAAASTTHGTFFPSPNVGLETRAPAPSQSSPGEILLGSCFGAGEALWSRDAG